MSPKQALVSGRFEDRLEFETLLADLSSRFVNLPPEDVNGAIESSPGRGTAVIAWVPVKGGAA